MEDERLKTKGVGIVQNAKAVAGRLQGSKVKVEGNGIGSVGSTLAENVAARVGHAALT